ncbi:MAG: hypothetical protein KGR26_16470, partial [Cyanobacteria bacterium REEB65]|nr:hypothetical protein [Cyanobacteria bacterium REEB65]
MKLFSKLFLALLGAGLLWPAQSLAAAAGPNEVRGHIEGPDGQPIAGVFVRQRGGVTGAFTDSTGDFTLRVDPQASSTLLATAPDRLPASAE